MEESVALKERVVRKLRLRRAFLILQQLRKSLRSRGSKDKTSGPLQPVASARAEEEVKEEDKQEEEEEDEETTVYRGWGGGRKRLFFISAELRSSWFRATAS